MHERTSSIWIVALVAFAGLFHFVPATSLPATGARGGGETKGPELVQGPAADGEAL